MKDVNPEAQGGVSPQAGHTHPGVSNL